ncbi:F0F1 ATP synthase subunit gamma [Azoarcus sp. L1K30]|uniref:F0F1 ATP synthase subunit gamma n=1 Tax=Azoarcus sp. L1K30 TaxID=2820277 RepID=UPI001B81FB3F|nr:FoF1 ATP synthase subunit gamma [Azoarcus sp. L1K30]MBR0565902.1 F0F1 ATP synthase subunit gamma [Azoarcus sp. L1K30]
MSKRRELQGHIESLADIGELLSAMKNLALVESRRIATFIDAQRAATRIVETTLAEFLADYPGHDLAASTEHAVLCVVGSERGFCGDLNQRLIAEVEPRRGDARIVLVGSRLADAWPDDDAPAALAGAGFADEVQNVLAALVARLTPLLQGAATHATPSLSMLYLTEHGPVQLQLLPAPTPTAGARRRSHPLELNLPPQTFHRALIDQFLETALSGALYDALLHENQLRLEHMEQARHRIDEQLDDLGRRSNRARQEEITEEIEIILLASLGGREA